MVCKNHNHVCKKQHNHKDKPSSVGFTQGKQGMTRRIGWRLYTLLSEEERDEIESLLMIENNENVIERRIKELREKVRSEHRVIFGKREKGRMGHVTYVNYAGHQDEIPQERVLWSYFSGTIEERGGITPAIVDACWTERLMVLIVKEFNMKSLYVTDDNVETKLHLKPSAKRINEVLSDGDYMAEIQKVLRPIENELAAGLMLKR